jgi:hypothetical protein
MFTASNFRQPCLTRFCNAFSSLGLGLAERRDIWLAADQPSTRSLLQLLWMPKILISRLKRRAEDQERSAYSELYCEPGM